MYRLLVRAAWACQVPQGDSVLRTLVCYIAQVYLTLVLSRVHWL